MIQCHALCNELLTSSVGCSYTQNLPEFAHGSLTSGNCEKEDGSRHRTAIKNTCTENKGAILLPSDDKGCGAERRGARGRIIIARADRACAKTLSCTQTPDLYT